MNNLGFTNNQIESCLTENPFKALKFLYLKKQLTVNFYNNLFVTQINNIQYDQQFIRDIFMELKT